MPITPFRIEVSDAALDDLHDAIARTRWPDEVAKRRDAVMARGRSQQG